MTTIYICRHSIPFKEHRGLENFKANFLSKNKMSPLSVSGEKEAEKLSELEELNNIDLVVSSEYVRALSTAKYIAYKNNIKVNIDERLGERLHGDIPNDINFDIYQMKQLNDDSYKLTNGENQIMVRKRMLECLNELLENNKDKNIFICSHSTAMTFLFMNWCKLDMRKKELVFKDKVIFDLNWNAPELFKLVFDNKELISIENIKVLIGKYSL